MLEKFFIGFKGLLGFYKKIKDGYTTLEKAEENEKNKSTINEILHGRDKSEEQNVAKKILKHFTNHEKKLSNCLMIILKLYLKLNRKQNMEKD